MFRSNIYPPSSVSKSKPSKKPAEAGGKPGLLDLHFKPEDGGDIRPKRRDVS
jgi:hypothetical protein